MKLIQSRKGMFAAVLLGSATTVFASSMFIDPTGYVGFGTDTPAARLHVIADSSVSEDAQVLVENANSAAPGIARKLFVIKNDGPAKFSMWASDNDEWAFNARTDVFRISKQGTGEVEMEVTENGNMFITGTLTTGSSRTIKDNIEPVDQQSVLERVVKLPISSWSYKTDGDVRHLGPMAEDFYASFGLGYTNKGLSSVDTGGVALAAIQGLKREKDREIERLKSENLQLKEELQRLERDRNEHSEKLFRLEVMVSQLLDKAPS